MAGEMLLDVVASHVANAAAAGTTNVNSSAVDQEGFSGVIFIADIGALTAGQQTQLEVQWSDTNNGSDWAAFTNPSGGCITPVMADGDSNELLIVDIFASMHRYHRAVLVRSTQNAVLNSIIAIQYRARNLPTTQGATVAESVAYGNPS